MPLPHSLPAGRYALAALAMTLAVAGCASTHGMAPQSTMRDSDRLQAGESRSLAEQLANGAPLARILAAGLKNHHASREVMKEAIEETGRAVAHELERFLTTLGTIAAMAPLLGLLGTVIGMIELFGATTPTGTNPQQLAHGISVALYNTAFGLVVAIPSMIFYRHFRAKVDALLVGMEQQAIHLVDVVHGDRTQ